VRRGRLITLAAVVLAAATPVQAARAADPGRWILTGASSVPVEYWQGLTSNPAKSIVYFAGPFEGVWSTTPTLRRLSSVPTGIPAQVTSSEGFNHIGDPTFDPGDGGRVILPLECYNPGANPSNTCGTGAFGVADPATLAWRYHVKLDRAEIPKAMWAETSPDGRLIWTSSGNDLLAYRTSDVTPAHAAPAGPAITAVRRLPGAVPPSGVTGGVFVRGRLLLAGVSDAGLKQIWSVNTRTGGRRLELEMQVCGEAEGLDLINIVGGRLHWLLSPVDPGCTLSFGPTSALMHFVRRPGRARLSVRVLALDAPAVPGRARALIRVTVGGIPVRGAVVRFAGGLGVTGRRGLAWAGARLDLPGRFKALARRGRSYGLSDLVPVGLAATAAAAPRFTDGLD
jgi:hypothetical protein